MLDTDNVLTLLKKRQAGRSLREFATELGVSPIYLSDIYARKRTPGEKVTSKLGLEKVVRFRQVA